MGVFQRLFGLGILGEKTMQRHTERIDSHSPRVLEIAAHLVD